ncbi:unnamed protein product [Rotaria sordida]|uniref:Uncharacterized protein n=1 Tax=Rotaria sordida TaxID=392033 RepID=A0A819Z4Z3_9BILA|nr:unnamed protein product [Rotaria sordida]CAF1099348.1 unnamed protein product [Rotaria sordida]CAF1151649.1 unnamed protein product [Rotaria sordida]CAF1485713.1 unnamed protein product [Rotaria sordida]CAF3885869.1 unnamed protein product [Rotaria sordida]
MVLNANINNNIDTIEITKDISIGTSEWIIVSPTTSHAPSNKQPAVTLSKASSSLDWMGLKNDIGNYINNR